MLASFVVSLKPLENAPLSDGMGASLHGLFFNLVRQGDAALAARLHDTESLKPFTVSPLRGRVLYQDGQRVALPTNTYWVRYTTLSDELFAALNAVLLGKYLYRESVALCGRPFQVTDVEVEPRVGKAWGRLATLADIWQAAAPLARVALRFYSATAFRQRGMTLMFPIPFNVFHSYREKWHAAGGQPIDDGLLRWVEENVAVEAYQLQTRLVLFGEHSLRGFTGYCRFAVRDTDPLRLKQLNALADFAFFCGTGMKTTQGMGQTRKVENPKSQIPTTND